MLFRSYTYVLYITRLVLSPTVVFGAKTPTTTVGDTQDTSHSVLLPSEPIKRLSQHSVAIQATPTLFAFRRGKGSTGGGGEGDTNYRGIRTSVLTYYIYIPHPPPTPPTPTPAPPTFHALSLCGVQVPRSGAKSRERRGGEEKGDLTTCKTRRRMPSEHRSPRTCSLAISPSASIYWFMSLSKATPVASAPPYPRT